MNPPTDGKCQRCREDAVVTTMSLFDTDMICNKCEKIERAHPQFPEARNVELDELSKGNYNFPGIGLPKDLQMIKEVT